jgi:hypothetical protein
MRKGPSLRYYGTGGLLGLGWLGVLMIPSSTRAWLLGEKGAWVWNVLFLVATSVLVAKVFRGFIARAETLSEHLVRAITVPYAGCMLYLTFWNIWNWSRHLASGTSASMHDTLVLYVWGVAFTTLAFFVVVPYALLCQWLMSKYATV